jgi:hemoglobin/transferrin/lactoferrin receptor protein
MGCQPAFDGILICVSRSNLYSMKKCAMLWCCLLSMLYVHAQTITVKESKTGQPLEFVNIFSMELEVFAVTDGEGKADISEFKEAEAIEFRLIGYQTVEKSFEELRESGFLLSMEQTQFALDQIVVSATRWNQSEREIPARVTTIPIREIRLQNPQTAADLLGASGEVFIQKSQQGGGSPMIRGYSTNRLLYTVDGVRMNTAIFRSGNLQNVISLDPLAIEGAEVLFGPGSVIYGSDAIGAVMAFQTLTPRFSLAEDTAVSGQLLSRYSSANNEKTFHADLNLGGEKWAFLSSVTATDFGDLRMGSNGPEEYLRPFYVRQENGEDVIVENEDPRLQTPNGYSQLNLMQKVRFRPSEAWDLQYGFHYSTTGDIPRYDRLIRTRRGLPRSAEWHYGPQKWMMNNLNITHNNGGVWYDQMSIRLAHQFFEESRIDRDFQSVNRSTRIEKVDAYSANIDFTKGLGATSELFYGMEVVHNRVNSTGTEENIQTGATQAGPARYPMADWASYAAYLVYKKQFSEKLTLQGGARYNFFSLDADFSNNLDFYPFPDQTASIDDGALTGSLGLVYTPGDDWMISTNLSSGFRSPNVDDIGKVFDSEPGAVVVPNPDLKAEYAYNAEFSLTKVLSNRVKVDLTAFYTHLDNALVRRDFQLNGLDSIPYDGELSQLQAIQNAAKARVYGVQSGIEVRFPGGWRLLSRFNMQIGEEELDDGTVSPSRHAAPWYGLTRLSYSAEKLDLQIYAMYSGERAFEDMPLGERSKDHLYAMDENGHPYSPGWFTLNIKGQYQLSTALTLNAGLENITDLRYRPYSSGIVAPGRNVVVSAQWSF